MDERDVQIKRSLRRKKISLINNESILIASTIVSSLSSKLPPQIYVPNEPSLT